MTARLVVLAPALVSLVSHGSCTQLLRYGLINAEQIAPKVMVGICKDLFDDHVTNVKEDYWLLRGRAISLGRHTRVQHIGEERHCTRSLVAVPASALYQGWRGLPDVSGRRRFAPRPLRLLAA